MSNTYYNPKVVLANDRYRAVLQPNNKRIIIEIASVDSLGVRQWSEVLTIEGTYSKSDFHAAKMGILYSLLVDGVKP